MKHRTGVSVLVVLAVIAGSWFIADRRRSADIAERPPVEAAGVSAAPQREQIVADLKQMRLASGEQQAQAELAAAEKPDGGEQPRERALRVRAPRQPGWHPERGSIATVSGTVVSLGSLAADEEGGGAESAHLSIDTGSEVITVKLGPAHYLREQKLQLEIEDEIVVTGLRKTARGAPLIVASSIAKDDYTLTLRAVDGKPAWRRSVDERRAERDERRRRQGVPLPATVAGDQVSGG